MSRVDCVCAIFLKNEGQTKLISLPAVISSQVVGRNRPLHGLDLEAISLKCCSSLLVSYSSNSELKMCVNKRSTQKCPSDSDPPLQLFSFFFEERVRQRMTNVRVQWHSRAQTRHITGQTEMPRDCFLSRGQKPHRQKIL